MLLEKIKDFAYFFINLLPRRSGVAILMYHSISDKGLFNTVKPKVFLKQMNYLKKKNYQVISLNDLVELLRQKKNFLRKPWS